MADEPSLGELGRQIGTLQVEMHRRLDTLNQRLTEFVPQNLYAERSQYISERLSQAQVDVQKVRDLYDQLENSFEQYQRDERDRRERERQSRMYQLTVPILLALLSAAVAIWAVVSK
ncbi:hypothetical protein [Streptomyces indicus]|uniref:Uncharacterized protein n=1 Tax=Streptomyces indicus TaxID=417292 RepID=A0A1G9IQP4_9ACTN|nr:hypothetical protein [Streptomyces indicus]SDL27490.1 hypothetical protein SAMN05421806_12511 [Streptomyces indicus]